MQKKYKVGLMAIVAVSVVAYVTRDTPKQKEQKYIHRGIEAFDKGDNIKARLNFKNAAKIMPTDPEIAYRWGLVDEAEGDIRNAFGNFLSAEQQSPHYAPAAQKIAHYFLAGNQAEQAQKRIDILLADDPKNAEAHALNAGVMLHDKKPAEATKEATLALSYDPDNVTAFSVLTGAAMAQKDLKKAGEILEDAIKHNPKNVALLMLKAGIYEKPFNAAKIKEAYDGIFALKPKDANYRLYLAQMYINANMIDDADTSLQASIKEIPADWNLKHAYFNFLAKFRSMDAAEKEVQGYMKANPDRGDLYTWLSDLYVQHDQTDKAIALLQQIIAKNDDDKQSLNASTSLASINFAKGDKADAEKTVNAVLAKTPTNSDALFIRANFETDRGQYDASVNDLRAVLRDRPKSKDALQLLGEVLLLQGYTDLAIETMNQLMEVDPTNPASRTRLAQMYSINKDFKRANEQLDLVLAATPQYPVAWETKARVAITGKDYDAAKAAIDKLDAIKGQHDTATFLTGQLAEGHDNHVEAIEDYKKVIDSNPSAPIAEHALYSLIGVVHTPEEMESVTNYIASLKTDSAYVSTLLGECYLQLSKKDLATAAFNKAIANHPINQEPYLNLARMAMADEKSDDALEILKNAQTAIPLDVRAPLMEATVRSQRGEYKEAIAKYDDILKSNPKMVLAANNMASIIADHFYTDSDMLAKAKETIEKFAASSEPSVLDTMGWIYYRLNKNDKALSLLSRAVVGEKIPPEIHYHYGAALLKSSNKPQAKIELQKATAENAKYPAIVEAKKILTGL